MTWNGTTGVAVPVGSDNGDASQQDLLNTNPDTGLDDGTGSDRLNFLRGIPANELAESSPTGPIFRNRIGERVWQNGVRRVRNRSTPLGDVGAFDADGGCGPELQLFAMPSYADFKLQYGDSECFAG